MTAWPSGSCPPAYERDCGWALATGLRLRVAGHDDHPFSRFTCPVPDDVSQDYDRSLAAASKPC
jgi:hypothetical protein